MAEPLVAQVGPPRPAPETSTPELAAQRVGSVDLVRGLAMVLMALDHVRYFVTDHDQAPENLLHTTLPLFFTRWVTHFCAPAFFLLAGTGAMLSQQAGRPARAVSGFLWKRGLLLVALELTVVGFAWQFIPGYSFAGVIWCLGVSMILLAGALRVATPATIGFAGVAMIWLHDLLDGVHGGQLGKAAWLWSLLHQSGDAQLGPITWFVLFPLVPWVGVMAAGYGLGLFYRPGWKVERLRWLWRLGAGSLLLFVVLRVAHLYGNPVAVGSGGAREPFAVHDSAGMTAVSLLDVEKYPPSLQYLLMTLGLVLLALAAAERWHPRWTQPLVVFGRVPLFFYVAHLYLIHLVALALAVATGQPWQWLGWGGQPIESRAGYGHGLPVVYLLWIGVTVALYPACCWYLRLKKRHRNAWLRLF
jgi:uncharacterized membrane protein